MTVEVDMGVDGAGKSVAMDLEELLATRLLVQGNSGSGKSHLLRRLLERSAGQVQQVVIDPEGDFVTLGPAYGHVVVEAADYDEAPSADASFTTLRRRACVVMTADCLPVIFCDRRGSRVAAAHAGWRGLADGVLAVTIAALQVPASDLIAWLGPAIEQSAFEVGDEVRERFVAMDAANATAFVPNQRERWQADLYELARSNLRRLGVYAIYGGGFACYADAQRFFSYRRDVKTGRMGTFVWLE